MNWERMMQLSKMETNYRSSYSQAFCRIVVLETSKFCKDICFMIKDIFYSFFLLLLHILLG